MINKSLFRHREVISVHNFYDLNPNHRSSSTEGTNSISLEVNTPLSNNKFNELLNAYCNSPNESTQNDLGIHLNNMNYLVGILADDMINTDTTVTEITIRKGDGLKFLICSNDDREVFLPVFTDDTEIKAWCTEPVYTLSVPAPWLWKFIINQKNYAGVLINPNSIAWAINVEHIQSLLQDIES